ncbi:ATP-binding cassette domain-containing protein [Paenibacillus albiflavus]|uniref:ATP-binding cassette domain-containing protein n=1 Tax=Paenibacillus albiflavus TaxID=2545760 RepID=A0A4R4EL29_9BACL|nr:ATP-binding cassette domain-containing protein [Paenibacillus albiflavus]TCZ80934.1 ATP-binding cassette domain-containing protein [Paenibacillus albiflavus]
MILLEGITKKYVDPKSKTQETVALRGIDLQIKQGEIFGMIGHSGAGKSTLLRMINLLERPTTGKVIINDVDLTSLSHKELQDKRRKIGMIFQHFNLLSSATVEQNIAFPLKLKKHSMDEINRKVEELVKLVGLEDHRTKYPSQLSGGQKQRVGIARALAADPDILLCDEATSALDPQTTNSILQLLLEINRTLGITIVLITHEMQVIRSICDRVAVINSGEIVELGNVVDVFLHPMHQVTKQFIQEIADADDHSSFLKGTELPNELVRITFLGEQTYYPILSETVQATGVTFAIMQGTISKMKDTPYGQLLVTFQGDQLAIKDTLTQLQNRGLHVEVIAC